MANNSNQQQLNHTFGNFEIVKLSESRYLNPYRVKYVHNNQNRAWDGILSHASVSCILFHTEKRAIILVRQFRPVVYVNQLIESHELANTPTANEENIIGNLDWSRVDPVEAITYELCAGICDKSKSLQETVKEEILEECGYDVDLKNIHRVKAFRTGVGLFGALHTIFYAEINESLKVSEGGGNNDEGEYIQLYELPENKVKEFMNDDTHPKPPGLLFGLQWFLHDREDFLRDKN